VAEPFDVEAAEAECGRLITAFPGDHPGVALAQDLLRLAQMWREEKAEVERLRAALEQIAAWSWDSGSTPAPEVVSRIYCEARAALRGEGEK